MAKQTTPPPLSVERDYPAAYDLWLRYGIDIEEVYAYGRLFMIDRVVPQDIADFLVDVVDDGMKRRHW